MLRLFRRTPKAETIEALYGAIVAQARAPVFYQNYGVADTVNGRLELLMLHLVLLFDRFSRAGPQERELGQAVFDRFCQDMDDHMREDGVSDLRVPKDMQRLAAGFFGRHRAYISALKANDRKALEESLRRNVLGDDPGREVADLAAYVEAAFRTLDGQDAAALVRGPFNWPDPVSLL